MERGEPKKIAEKAIQETINELLNEQEWKDIDWLPKDLHKKLVEYAWDSAGSSKTTRLKNNLRTYIDKEIMPEGENT